VNGVSVVVPTYNRAASLTRLLASVAASDDVVGPLQITVVDDGSPSGTYADAAERFPDVVWMQQHRAGPAAARNRGWRASTGEVVVFVDDDCVLERDTLARLQAEMADADAVGATIEPLTTGHVVADFMHAEHLVTHKVEDGAVRWLVTACMAMRSSVLEEVDGFDEHFSHAGGEDADLSLRLRRGGYRLAVSEDAVARHDHRAGLRDLVRTYYRHGTAQRHLAHEHTERQAELGQSVRSRVSPRAWYGIYLVYRQEANVPTSLAFVGLRAAMMVPWLVGAAVGPSRRSRA
jgi:GT2 family glycosyltransferase